MVTVVTELPPVPSRSNAPDLFADRADAFLGAFPQFRNELNALGAEIEGAGADAAAQVALAEAQVTLATTQAGIATTQAGLALTRAGDANTSANAAANSASDALTSANNAAASLASFDLKYLGSKSADPTTNNSGGALVEGQIYWHSGANELRFYNGSTWTTANLVAANYFVKTGDTITGPTIVDVNSASTALRITQSGTGNAFVVEDVASDTTPFTILADGTVLAGTSTSVSATAGAGKIQAESLVSFMARYAGVDTSPPIIDFLKSRNGAVVVNGDSVGQLRFSGFDGTLYRRVAQITANVDGVPGTDDMPGNLSFATTADGAASPTERMRITSAGDVGIGVTPTAAANQISLHIKGISDRANVNLETAAADGSAVTTGTLSFYGGTSVSSSAEKRVVIVGGITDGATANHRGGAFTISTKANNSTVLTEYFRINSSGFIGLGQASPIARVDVSGNYASNIIALGAGVGALDCSLGNYFTTSVTTGTLTFSFTNVPASRAFSITVEVNHTAGTIAFPGSVSFPNSGTAPTLTAGKRHLLGFITSNGGTTWRLVSSTNYNT